MSDSGSSSSRGKSRSRSKSRSRRKSYTSRDGSPARRLKSKSRSESRSRSRSRRRYRSPSHSRSRSRSYDRKRSDKHSSSRRSSRRERSASPLSNRRRHLGDRDNPRQSRCLGVFGLSLYTTERELRDLFERYGPIENLQIVYDHQTGRSRGFGFIYMKNAEDAAEAKDQLPGTELDGHKIRVDYSVTTRPHTPTPGVYLGRPTTSSSYRRSPPRGFRRSDYGRRRSPSYSRSYSRSPRR